MNGRRRRTVLVLALGAAVLAAGCTGRQARLQEALRAKLAASKVTVVDSFDARLAWKTELDQGDPATLEAVAADAAKKDQAMAVTFELGKKKKVVLGRPMGSRGVGRDLSKCNLLALDVDSKLAAKCGLSVAMHTVPGWKYFESPVVVIRPGINKDVVFRLDLPNFKCEASKWLHNRPIANRSDTRKLVLVIHPVVGGSIRINNLRVGAFQAPAAAKTAAAKAAALKATK